MYMVVYKMKKVRQTCKKLNDEGDINIKSNDIQAYKKMIMSQESMQNDPNDMNLRSIEQEPVAEYRVVHNAYLSFQTKKDAMV